MCPVSPRDCHAVEQDTRQRRTHTWPGSRVDEARSVVATLLLRGLHRATGNSRKVLPMWPVKSVTHVPGCTVV
jgi:hypothetical protein